MGLAVPIHLAADFLPRALQVTTPAASPPSGHNGAPTCLAPAARERRGCVLMLADRDLKRLVLGQFISALGDQFYLLALPWLALATTGSALAAGSLVALAGVPRAALMLVGGAFTDRYTPRRLLVASNNLQALLMVLFGLSVLLTLPPFWVLAGLSLAVGVVDAFGLPALNALLPRVVAAEDLEGGNLYLQGANLASGVLGPALAGVLIAATSGLLPGGTPRHGLGLAFLVNAVTFVAGVALFRRIQGSPREGSPPPTGSLLASLGDLAAFVRADRRMKYLLGLLMALGLFLSGTVRVGFPLLAERYYGGVQALGALTSAIGVGTALGTLALRLLPRPPKAWSGTVVLALFSSFPVGLMLLALVPPFWAGLAVVVVMGLGLGYVMLYLISWLQRWTPASMHGRVMALAFFFTLGLSPLSQVLMGFLLDRALRSTLLGIGSLVLALLLLAATRREMRGLERPCT